MKRKLPVSRDAVSSPVTAKKKRSAPRPAGIAGTGSLPGSLRARQSGSERHDLAAVEPLLDLRRGVADLGHGLTQLRFAAIESFSPPAHFTRIIQVDQAAVGGDDFEHVGHRFALPFVL